MNKVGLIGAALAGLLLSTGAHAATIVANGSFEDGAFDGAANPDGAGDNTDNLAGGSTDITGWTTDADHDVAWIGAGNPFGLTASDGEKFLDLSAYTSGAPFGGVSQTIATVIGQAYALTFDLGSSGTYGLPSAILASAGLTSLTFTSTLSGTDNWEHELLSFVATGTSTVISFKGATGANYIGLDNVNVAATPLPAPVLMFLTAMLPLGFVGYRRMKQTNA